jgi:hypothetical protein
LLKIFSVHLTLLFILNFISANQAYAFGTPEHSKVIVTSKKLDNKQIEFQFQIVANKGMKITFDAPWELSIKKHKGLKLDSDRLKVKALDKKIPGFIVKSEKITQMNGEIEFKLVSFICTSDKTRCFREVHKEKFEWKQ